MAPAQDGTAAIAVHDVLAMTDAELAQFMEKHHGPGGYELPIDVQDDVSREQREQLAQRLTARGHDIAETCTSRPLDLDDLDARLRRVPVAGGSSPRSESPKSQDDDPSTFDLDFEEDTFHHQELLLAHGRPVYPQHLILEVHHHPDKYSKMLRPWQTSVDGQVRADNVLRRQLSRWKAFRSWQDHNRGISDNDADFIAFVEGQKRHAPGGYSHKQVSQRIAEIDNDLPGLKSQWEMYQQLTYKERSFNTRNGCNGFHEYVKETRSRLLKHGFNGTFEFDEDAKNQDPWTTWVEYLNYELAWLDKYDRDVENLRPRYEDAWRELVGTNVLRRHETDEYLRSPQWSIEYRRDGEMAMEAVKRAESQARETFTGPSSIPAEERALIVTNATARLQKARDRYNQVQDRVKLVKAFIKATSNYQEAKEISSVHRLLVEWVREQLPIIETEMAQPNGGSTAFLAQDKKRKRVADPDPLENRESKQPRLISNKPDPRPRNIAKVPSPKAKEAAAVGTPSVSAAFIPKAIPQTIPQGPRRSERIAAQRMAVKERPEIPKPKSQARSVTRPKRSTTQPARLDSVAGVAKVTKAGRAPKGPKRVGQKRDAGPSSVTAVKENPEIPKPKSQARSVTRPKRSTTQPARLDSVAGVAKVTKAGRASNSPKRVGQKRDAGPSSVAPRRSGRLSRAR